jgi:hypothetical protein
VSASRASQRTVVLAALALATPVLAGCGISSGDETSKEPSQIQAANARIGDVHIRNAFITALPTTTTTPPGSAHSYLVVTLVNNAPDTDTFTGVSTGLGVADLVTHTDGAGAARGVDLPSGLVVQVSNPAINPDAPTLEITGNPPVVGTTELVTFSFDNAGTTRPIPVPVVSPGNTLASTQVVPTDQATFSIPIE